MKNVPDAADQPVEQEIFFPVRVTEKDRLAVGIERFELRDPEGGPLPAFTAGAHLTVLTPRGARRSYSLCNDPAERDRYVLAIKRDPLSRGGSVSMIDDVRAGDRLQVSTPLNNFELSKRARKHLFIAGGIGITPIISMMRHLQSEGTENFHAYYLTRSAEETAFLSELNRDFAGMVTIHHDGGDTSKALDLWPVLEKPSGADIYCCGPQRLMDSVRDMSGHWPSDAVHFESFGVDSKVRASNKPFQVRLSAGRVIEVPADQSILEALRVSGIRVPSSCESGTCGSCKVRLLGGEAEHRDLVLSESEQSTQIMVCVSRAKSHELVLDL